MSHIKVAVRVRPLNNREVDSQAKLVVDVNKETISITNPRLDTSTSQLLDIADSRERTKSFVFDYAYLSTERQAKNYSGQEIIFEDLGCEVLEAAFDGYNACIFAYGQTGSGKTYTMMGNDGDIGLTPRILQGLFARVNGAQADPKSNISCRVDVSYMEIYNERVRDLLRPSVSKRDQGQERYTLKVREHPKDGPYVQDLSRHIVKDNESVQALLDKGNEKRITAATHYHDHSSRSHAIFTINFTQAKLDKDLPCETVSKIHLVDLAGSERANQIDYDKDRLKEGANINKSLVTLGNVIKALAQQSSFGTSHENLAGSLAGTPQGLLSSDVLSRSPSPVFRKRSQASLFVPYRDSVLTWLLKDSLGGNSKTIMIANISPSSIYYAETLNTLRYAQRTKSIINKPTVNEDANVKLIRDLRGEIDRLRQLLVTTHMRKSTPIPELLYSYSYTAPSPCNLSRDKAQSTRSLCDMETTLVEKLEENEAVAKSMLSNWLDKWQEAHDIMRESDIMIRRGPRKASSMGVIVDSQLPHLVGIDDDILSTGVIIYHIKEGVTTIGSDEDAACDIALNGPGITPEHCVIKYTDGNVYLLPNPQAYCSVNGIDVTEPTRLTQGDVVMLGQTNMFRFNNPSEAAVLRKKRMSLGDIGLRRNSSNKELFFKASVSRASSAASLYNVGVDCDSPATQHRGVDNAVFIFEDEDYGQDLDAFYHSEVERIQNAKEELERLQMEHAAAEEERARREEQLMLTHERKVLEMERLERHLELMISDNEATRVAAEREIYEARLQLEEDKRLHIEQITKDLADVTALKGSHTTTTGTATTSSAGSCGTSTDIQTDTLLTENIETQTDDLQLPLTGDANALVKTHKVTIQGKLKDLTQRELMFRLQDFHNQQELENKETEYQIAISDAQDEIYDVKYHLNELKHSISVAAIDDAIAIHDDGEEEMDQSECDDDDLDQSHDLGAYMALGPQASTSSMTTTAEQTPEPGHSAESSTQSVNVESKAEGKNLQSRKSIASTREYKSPSPERLKVSRRASSVTSRLFPQYQVKFEYKSPHREPHSPTRGEKHECACCSSPDRHRDSVGTLKNTHRPKSRGSSPNMISPTRSNPSNPTPPSTPPTNRRTPVQPRTNPRASRNSPSPSPRSQSAELTSPKPRKTWEKPGPHQRSRSVPTDLARLAAPKKPLPPVKRTVLEGWEIRKRDTSPVENQKKKKVKKATSLSRIPETNSDDDRSKQSCRDPANMGSLPCFNSYDMYDPGDGGTYPIPDGMHYQDRLTHDIDLTSSAPDRVLPVLPFIPPPQESEDCPSTSGKSSPRSPRRTTQRGGTNDDAMSAASSNNSKGSSKSKPSSRPKRQPITRPKSGTRRTQSAEIPVEIFLPPSPLRSKDFVVGHGGGGGGGNPAGRCPADSEIFDVGDPYHQRFAKTLRDQDHKRKASDDSVSPAGSLRKKSSTSKRPSISSLTSERQSQSNQELRYEVASNTDDDVDHAELRAEYERLLKTQSTGDIAQQAKSASRGDSVDSVTEVSPRTSDNMVVGGAGVDVSPSILELHRIEDVSPESTTSNGTPIQDDEDDNDVDDDEIELRDSPPMVHFYEDGKLVPLTEGYLAQRKAVAAKALEDTRAKYEELERTVKEISIKKRGGRRGRKKRAAKLKTKKDTEESFSEDSLIGDQHVSRLSRRKRRSAPPPQKKSHLSSSSTESVHSDDSLTAPPAVKRSPSAQYMAEELFKLRKDFLDEKFSQDRDTSKSSLSALHIPTWDSTTTDLYQQKPTVVSVYNVSPKHPSSALPRLQQKRPELSITPIDLWNTGDILSSTPGKFIVTGRVTSKLGKPGVFTHSRTDVWGSIHPANDAHNLGSDEIIIAEARFCNGSASDDSLTHADSIKTLQSNNPLSRSRISVESYGSGSDLAASDETLDAEVNEPKDFKPSLGESGVYLTDSSCDDNNIYGSTDTTNLLAGVNSETCSVSTYALLASSAQHIDLHQSVESLPHQKSNTTPNVTSQSSQPGHNMDQSDQPASEAADQSDIHTGEDADIDGSTSTSVLLAGANSETSSVSTAALLSGSSHNVDHPDDKPSQPSTDSNTELDSNNVQSPEGPCINESDDSRDPSSDHGSPSSDNENVQMDSSSTHVANQPDTLPADDATLLSQMQPKHNTPQNSSMDVNHGVDPLSATEQFTPSGLNIPFADNDETDMTLTATDEATLEPSLQTNDTIADDAISPQVNKSDYFSAPATHSMSSDVPMPSETMQSQQGTSTRQQTSEARSGQEKHNTESRQQEAPTRPKESNTQAAFPAEAQAQFLKSDDQVTPPNTPMATEDTVQSFCPEAIEQLLESWVEDAVKLSQSPRYETGRLDEPMETSQSNTEDEETTQASGETEAETDSLETDQSPAKSDSTSESNQSSPETRNKRRDLVVDSDDTDELLAAAPIGSYPEGYTDSLISTSLDTSSEERPSDFSNDALPNQDSIAQTLTTNPNQTPSSDTLNEDSRNFTAELSKMPSKQTDDIISSGSESGPNIVIVPENLPDTEHPMQAAGTSSDVDKQETGEEVQGNNVSRHATEPNHSSTDKVYLPQERISKPNSSDSVISTPEVSDQAMDRSTDVHMETVATHATDVADGDSVTEDNTQNITPAIPGLDASPNPIQTAHSFISELASPSQPSNIPNHSLRSDVTGESITEDNSENDIPPSQSSNDIINPIQTHETHNHKFPSPSNVSPPPSNLSERGDVIGDSFAEENSQSTIPDSLSSNDNIVDASNPLQSTQSNSTGLTTSSNPSQLANSDDLAERGYVLGDISVTEAEVNLAGPDGAFSANTFTQQSSMLQAPCISPLEHLHKQNASSLLSKPMEDSDRHSKIPEENPGSPEDSSHEPGDTEETTPCPPTEGSTALSDGNSHCTEQSDAISAAQDDVIVACNEGCSVVDEPYTDPSLQPSTNATISECKEQRSAAAEIQVQPSPNQSNVLLDLTAGEETAQDHYGAIKHEDSQHNVPRDEKSSPVATSDPNSRPTDAETQALHRGLMIEVPDGFKATVLSPTASSPKDKITSEKILSPGADTLDITGSGGRSENPLSAEVDDLAKGNPIILAQQSGSTHNEPLVIPHCDIIPESSVDLNQNEIEMANNHPACGKDVNSTVALHDNLEDSLENKPGSKDSDQHEDNWKSKRIALEPAEADAQRDATGSPVSVAVLTPDDKKDQFVFNQAQKIGSTPFDDVPGVQGRNTRLTSKGRNALLDSPVIADLDKEVSDLTNETNNRQWLGDLPTIEPSKTESDVAVATMPMINTLKRTYAEVVKAIPGIQKPWMYSRDMCASESGVPDHIRTPKVLKRQSNSNTKYSEPCGFVSTQKPDHLFEPILDDSLELGGDTGDSSEASAPGQVSLDNDNTISNQKLPSLGFINAAFSKDSLTDASEMVPVSHKIGSDDALTVLATLGSLDNAFSKDSLTASSEIDQDSLDLDQSESLNLSLSGVSAATSTTTYFSSDTLEDDNTKNVEDMLDDSIDNSMPISFQTFQADRPNLPTENNAPGHEDVVAVDKPALEEAAPKDTKVNEPELKPACSYLDNATKEKLRHIRPGPLTPCSPSKETEDDKSHSIVSTGSAEPLQLVETNPTVSAKPSSPKNDTMLGIQMMPLQSEYDGPLLEMYSTQVDETLTLSEYDMPACVKTAELTEVLPHAILMPETDGSYSIPIPDISINVPCDEEEQVANEAPISADMKMSLVGKESDDSQLPQTAMLNATMSELSLQTQSECEDLYEQEMSANSQLPPSQADVHISNCTLSTSSQKEDHRSSVLDTTMPPQICSSKGAAITASEPKPLKSNEYVSSSTVPKAIDAISTSPDTFTPSKLNWELEEHIDSDTDSLDGALTSALPTLASLGSQPTYKPSGDVKYSKPTAAFELSSLPRTGAIHVPTPSSGGIVELTDAEGVAEDIVHNVIMDSVSYLVTRSAVQGAMLTLDHADSMDDARSTPSSEKSFNELVGISSRVFYPDGTAVEDHPLKFHDPPLSPLACSRQNRPATEVVDVVPTYLSPTAALPASQISPGSQATPNTNSDSLILRSEQVELDGTGVHVISVPWSPPATNKQVNKNKPSPRKSLDVPRAADEHFVIEPVDSAVGQASAAVEGIPTEKSAADTSTSDLNPGPSDLIADSPVHQDQTTTHTHDDQGTAPTDSSPSKQQAPDEYTADVVAPSSVSSAAPPGGSPHHHASTITSESEMSDSPSDGSYELARDIMNTLTPILYGIEENTDEVVRPEATIQVHTSPEDGDAQNQPSADSGNGSDHAQYPEDQSPRTMSTASGESITYVFMMRSYSADEVNAGGQDSEPDIDADQLFGDTSFSLDMSHDQANMVRHQSEPSVFTGSLEKSSLSISSQARQTAGSDSRDLDRDLDHNLDALIFGDSKPEDEAIGRYLEAVKAAAASSAAAKSAPADKEENTSDKLESADEPDTVKQETPRKARSQDITKDQLLGTYQQPVVEEGAATEQETGTEENEEAAIEVTDSKTATLEPSDNVQSVHHANVDLSEEPSITKSEQLDAVENEPEEAQKLTQQEEKIDKPESSGQEVTSSAVFTDERATLPPPPYSQHSCSVSSKVQEWLKVNHSDEPGQLLEAAVTPTTVAKLNTDKPDETETAEQNSDMPSALLDDAVVDAYSPSGKTASQKNGEDVSAVSGLGLTAVSTFEFVEHQVQSEIADEEERSPSTITEEEIEPVKQERVASKLALGTNGNATEESSPLRSVGESIIIREIPPTPGSPDEQQDDIVFIDAIGRGSENAHTNTDIHSCSNDAAVDNNNDDEQASDLHAKNGYMPERHTGRIGQKPSVDSATSMNGDVSSFGGETVVTTECLPSPRLSRKTQASTEVSASATNLNLSRHTVATTECVPSETVPSEPAASADGDLTTEPHFALGPAPKAGNRTRKDSTDSKPTRPDSAPPPNSPASPALQRKQSTSRRRSSSSKTTPRPASPTKKSPTSPTKATGGGDWASSLRSYGGKDIGAENKQKGLSQKQPQASDKENASTSTVPKLLVDSGVGCDTTYTDHATYTDRSYVDSGTDAVRLRTRSHGTDADTLTVDHCVGDDDPAMPLSRTWASQTDVHFKPLREKSDSYRRLTKDKRLTHGGSLTFDMNTMTDDVHSSEDEMRTPRPLTADQRVLSFDMQTSTTDLQPSNALVKKRAVSRSSLAAASERGSGTESKLGTIGKGLSKKQSTTSIQDILDMLPSTSVQTGGSLWGMERLPLYDAAVRTNHDLVQAAADLTDPNIASMELELEQIDRLIRKAEEMRRRKMELISSASTTPAPLTPVGTSSANLTPGGDSSSGLTPGGTSSTQQTPGRGDNSSTNTPRVDSDISLSAHDISRAPVDTRQSPTEMSRDLSHESHDLEWALITGPSPAMSVRSATSSHPTSVMTPESNVTADTSVEREEGTLTPTPDSVHNQTAPVMEDTLTIDISQLQHSASQASLAGSGEGASLLKIGSSRESIDHQRPGSSMTSTPRSRTPSSRREKMQELLNSVDATLARYGNSAGAGQVGSSQTNSELKPELTSTGTDAGHEAGQDYVIERTLLSPRDGRGSAMSLVSTSSTVRDEQTDVDLDALDKLRKERLKIVHLLGRDYNPSKLWVEMAEAQLNYAFGQTDTLLEALALPPGAAGEDRSEKRHSMGGFLSALNFSEETTRELRVLASTEELVRQKTEQLEESKRQIEERIQALEQQVQVKNKHSNKSHRSSKTNLSKVRRKAEIEIFKLEREREINYVKATSDQHASSDRLADHSDSASVVSVRSDVSGASGAPLSANLVTPRQHLRRLTNVRRQIVTETAASSSKSGDSTPTNLTSPAAQVETFRVDSRSGRHVYSSSPDRSASRSRDRATTSTVTPSSSTTGTASSHIRLEDDPIEKLRQRLYGYNSTSQIASSSPNRVLTTYPDTPSTVSTPSTGFSLPRYNPSTGTTSSSGYGSSNYSGSLSAYSGLNTAYPVSNPSLSSYRSPISSGASALKTSNDIEDQIEQELSKLNSQYSASPGYRLHDSRSSAPRPGLLSTTSALYSSPEHSYKNTSVSSLAKAVSDIKNYSTPGVASSYRRRRYYY